MNKHGGKRIIAAGIAFLAVALSASVAFAMAPAKVPLIGPAHATLSLEQTVKPTDRPCTGPEPINPGNYTTKTGGTWSGTIDDNGSMMIPYRLHGTVNMGGTLTIHQETGMAVLVGTMQITGDTTPQVDARGPITLPAQLDLTGEIVSVRGMVNLPLYTAGQKNGSFLIANMVLHLNLTSGQVVGSIGSIGSPEDYTVDNFSIEYNGQTC